jgi:hypothetical protein
MKTLFYILSTLLILIVLFFLFIYLKSYLEDKEIKNAIQKTAKHSQNISKEKTFSFGKPQMEVDKNKQYIYKTYLKNNATFEIKHKYKVERSKGNTDITVNGIKVAIEFIPQTNVNIDFISTKHYNIIAWVGNKFINLMILNKENKVLKKSKVYSVSKSLHSITDISIAYSEPQQNLYIVFRGLMSAEEYYLGKISLKDFSNENLDFDYEIKKAKDNWDITNLRFFKDEITNQIYLTHTTGKYMKMMSYKGTAQKAISKIQPNLELTDYSILAANPSMHKILKIRNGILWYAIRGKADDIDEERDKIKTIPLNKLYKK